MKGYTIQHSIELLEKQAGSGSGGASTAAQVSFDNTGTGLVATNVQSAISEVNTKAGAKPEYKTTETVIGKWTDGRDVCQRVIVTESAYDVSNSTFTPITEADLTGVDLVIGGTFIRIGNKAPIACDFDLNQSTHILGARQHVGNLTTLNFGIGSTLILEYVKTTAAKSTRKSSK